MLRNKNLDGSHAGEKWRYFWTLKRNVLVFPSLGSARLDPLPPSPILNVLEVCKVNLSL